MSSPAVLALDIGGTKLSAGILGPGGELRRHATERARREAGAASVLERAVSLAREVMDAETRAGGQVSALGVSTNGLTREHCVELAPSIPGWELLQIPARLRKEFGGLPTAIMNDVKAATVAEQTWVPCKGCRTAST